MTTIQIYINGEWQVLDSYGDNIAITFQANTLADFQDRNGSYSQNISLPKSPRNMRLLGVGMRVDSDSSIPYTRYPVEVLDQGLPLFNTPSVLKLIRMNEKTIDCQILSNVIDIFSRLDKPLVSEDNDGTWFLFDPTGFEKYSTPTAMGASGIRMVMGFANVIKSLSGLTSFNIPDSFYQEPTHFYPHLNFYDIVKWIFGKMGYDFEAPYVMGAGLSNQEFIPCLFPAASESGEQTEYTQQTNTTFTIPTTVSAGGSRRVPLVSIIPVAPKGWISRDPVDPTNDVAINFVAPGTLHLRTSVTHVSGSLFVTPRFQAYICDKHTGEVLSAVPFSGSTINYDTEIDLEEGQYVRLSLTATWERTPTSTETWNTTYEVTWKPEPTEDYQYHKYTRYDLVASLGFNTCLDLVKEFLLLHGLTPEVDEANKKIVFHNLGEIRIKTYPDTYDVFDWSKKLVPGESKIEYQLQGWAQENKIRFATNDVTGFTDEITIPVPNENLDLLKDLWTSKFVSSERTYPPGFSNINSPVVSYPLFDLSMEGGRVLVTGNKAQGPVLCRVISSAGTTVNLFLDWGDGNDLPTKVLAIWSFPADSLFYSSYTAIRDIFKDLKLVEADFLLTPVDIQALDLTTPVYVEGFGAHFYISKISNYTPGKPTRVTLIKL